MAARLLSAVRNQLAFDEQLVEDTALERALEERQSRKDSLNAVRKEYAEAHEQATAEIAKQELPVGKVIRVGRFRITRQDRPSRSVSFETKPSNPVRISLVGDDE
jgi:hypothetical protein